MLRLRQPVGPLDVRQSVVEIRAAVHVPAVVAFANIDEIVAHLMAKHDSSWGWRLRRDGELEVEVVFNSDFKEQRRKREREQKGGG